MIACCPPENDCVTLGPAKSRLPSNHDLFERGTVAPAGPAWGRGQAAGVVSVEDEGLGVRCSCSPRTGFGYSISSFSHPSSKPALRVRLDMKSHNWPLKLPSRRPSMAMAGRFLTQAWWTTAV